jgi:hypothetical protein
MVLTVRRGETEREKTKKKKKNKILIIKRKLKLKALQKRNVLASLVALLLSVFSGGDSRFEMIEMRTNNKTPHNKRYRIKIEK